MADNETLSDGFGGTITVSMDEAASGQVQRMKLAYSADGSDTHVTADASGLLVNLGTNNDVTLTSGTLTAIAGTVTTSIAGTPSFAISSGTASFTLGAGATVGISADGTAVADLLSLTSGTAVAVGIYDTDGVQISFSAPAPITFAPTIGTAACVQLDSLHTTIITFSGAANVQNGTGSIIGAGLWDKDDIGDAIRMWVFSRSVTGTTANDQLSVSDTDLAFCVGFIDFDDWADGANGKFSLADRTRLPLPYHCTNNGTSLYGILQYVDTGTPTYSAGGLGGFIHVVAD